MSERLSDVTKWLRATSDIYDLAWSLSLDVAEQDALQGAIKAAADEMIRAGESKQAVVTAMLNVIMDGLLYGNWPWALEKLKG